MKFPCVASRGHRSSTAVLVWLAPAILCMSGAAARAAESESEWLIAPYFWAPHVKGKVGLGPLSVDLDVKPQELAGGTHAAAMGYLRWSGGRHFVYIEGIGIQFSDEEFKPFFDQDVESELIFSEIGYGRHFDVSTPLSASGTARFSPYVGVRHIRLDIAVNSPFLGLSADERWLDPAVGITIEAPLYKRLGYALKLDGAGFGIDRNHYWNGIAGVTFSATRSLNLVAAYRLTKFKAHPGGGNDLQMHLRGDGPMIGMMCHF